MQTLISIRRKIKISILAIFRRLKYLSFLFNLILLSTTLIGQNGNNRDTLKIRCALPNRSVVDGKDLRAKIVITNNSDHKIWVYSELVEGTFLNILDGNINNVELIVQRKGSHKFSDYSKGVFIDPPPVSDTNDNPKKIRLLPKDSVVNYFNVDSRYKFVSGDYRMKCLYWNNNRINKTIQSNWIYFRVGKTVYVNHYPNEPSSTDSNKLLH